MALESIGALWLKEKNGKKFMSGMIEEDKIVFAEGKAGILMYKNDYKKEERHPDYKIFQIVEEEQAPRQPEQREPEEDLDSILF